MFLREKARVKDGFSREPVGEKKRTRTDKHKASPFPLTCIDRFLHVLVDNTHSSSSSRMLVFYRFVFNFVLRNGYRHTLTYDQRQDRNRKEKKRRKKKSWRTLSLFLFFSFHVSVKEKDGEGKRGLKARSRFSRQVSLA